MLSRQFLVEAAMPDIGRKYQHLEDLVYTNGSQGALHAIERLRRLPTEYQQVEVKWDGSPVFFWGRDVVHPDGNLLVRQGFSKSPSAGLQGTSCYGLDWQGGRIELHGACAGWYPRDGGEGFNFFACNFAKMRRSIS